MLLGVPAKALDPFGHEVKYVGLEVYRPALRLTAPRHQAGVL